MMTLLLAAGLLVSPPADTVMAASRGDRLQVETRSGSITVQVWDRSEVALESADRIELRRDGDRIVLSGNIGRRARREDVRLSVPAWMNVRIAGRELDVDVQGLEGDLTVRTLEGDVSLERLSGAVDVRSVSGTITVEDLSGDVQLGTVEGEVDVRGARGRLAVQSTDGDLTLHDIAVDTLSAETLDGDIVFQGRVLRGSRMRLATHDGDISVTVPEGTGAAVSVSTFDGEFEPGFPVQVRSLHAGEPLSFVMGGGGAVLELQAFDGDIRLRHGG